MKLNLKIVLVDFSLYFLFWFILTNILFNNKTGAILLSCTMYTIYSNKIKTIIRLIINSLLNYVHIIYLEIIRIIVR